MSDECSFAGPAVEEITARRVPEVTSELSVGRSVRFYDDGTCSVSVDATFTADRSELAQASMHLAITSAFGDAVDAGCPHN